MSRDPLNELISLEGHGEFYLVQFAHFGALAESFFEHKSIRDRFPVERDFMNYLAGRSRALLEEHGDIRLRGPIAQINLRETLHA